MKTNKNDSVYPCGYKNANANQMGLSKREYFAVMAMQGLLAGADFNMQLNELVLQSLSCADALIKALNAEDSPR